LVQPSAEELERFALPHAGAALSLARALARSDSDAEDVVQEPLMRALKYFRGVSGEHPRAWLLSIVRNVAYALHRRNGQTEPVAELDEERGGRLDYLDGQPVAALVYRAREHAINVFAWPAGAARDVSPRRETRTGIHSLHWVRDGMAWWVVSDVGSDELEHLAALLREPVQ
jgi:DNA-directed RNA polymerase specialized sigma24 family protein